MSRIFMDGFESGDLNSWSSEGTFPGINSSVSGRTGNYCTYFNAAGIVLDINILSISNIYMAYKLRPETFAIGAGGLRFYNGTTHLGGLNQNSLPQFYWGTTNVNLVSTSSISTSTSQWNLMEIYYLPHLTNGTFILKVNGIIAINESGVKTSASTLNINKITFQVNNSAYFYLDDFILDDANWIGPSSIQGLAVTGAGNSAQFDPSTGNNYACVDEIPPSDADYISTNTPNEIDTYACGDLTGTINSIKAVQVQARCMQEGSPAVPKIQLVTRPTSTDRVSASKSVQTFAPGTVSNIWELNPDDSAAWSEADVNGMEIGVKAVAS